MPQNPDDFAADSASAGGQTRFPGSGSPELLAGKDTAADRGSLDAAVAQDSDESALDARDTVSRAELEKVIRERQAAKERARAAEAELAATRKKLAAADAGDQPTRESPPAGQHPDGDGRAAEARRNAPTRPDDNATGPAQDDIPGRPSQSDLEARLRSRELQLASLLRDQQLRAAAEAAGAVNPDQVVALLRTRVVMEESANGEFIPSFLDERGRSLVDANGAPPDADAFVGEFLLGPATRTFSAPRRPSAAAQGAPAERQVSSRRRAR